MGSLSLNKNNFAEKIPSKPQPKSETEKDIKTSGTPLQPAGALASGAVIGASLSAMLGLGFRINR